MASDQSAGRLRMTVLQTLRFVYNSSRVLQDSASALNEDSVWKSPTILKPVNHRLCRICIRIASFIRPSDRTSISSYPSRRGMETHA